MSMTKKRWLVLAFACLVNLCLGSVYAWSVFAGPMAEHLSALTGRSLTAADLAIAYTVANSVGPITMISGGWVNDRFGPRNVVLAGGLMFGAGMILSGFAPSLPLLVLAYGLLGGLGMGMAYGCTISCCVKFFPDKRGLTGGLTTAAYGLGAVVLPPVANLLVEAAGVTRAFVAVGCAFLALILVSSRFILPCPAGFVPEGWTPPAAQAATPAAADKDWRQMLKSPVFYLMLLTLLSGAFSGMMIISQASAVGQELAALSVGVAGLAVSAIALCNSLGRILVGSLSDRIGRVSSLTLACVLSVAGNGLLYFCSGKAVLFFVGACLVGLSFGAFMGVFPGFTADAFGPKNNSVNYGIMFIGFALAGYFGPTLMKQVYYGDGTYQNAFLIAAALSCAGLGLTLALGAVFRRQRKQ